MFYGVGDEPKIFAIFEIILAAFLGFAKRIEVVKVWVWVSCFHLSISLVLTTFGADNRTWGMGSH